MAPTTVANTTARAILRFCAARGLTTEVLLSSARIQRKQITDPEARLAAEQAFALWGEAQNYTKDALIAVRTAEFLPFGAYKVIDYLLATSSTPRDSLNKLARNFRLVNGAFELQLTSHNGVSRFELHNPFDPEGPSRLYVEFIFAIVQSRLRSATEINWHPREIWFTHSTLGNVADYCKLFQCAVRFNQALNQMVLDKRLLDVSQPQADPSLSEMLDYHAQRLLRQLPAEDDFLSEVRTAMREGLDSGDVCLKTTAMKLAISCRALQRKLNEQGISYREVLDRIRYELAIDLLAKRQLEIEEIAQVLRFSEPSALYRAFRRWTGKTPQEYLEA